MKSLATKAASGQESTTDLTSLNAEFADLQNEIDQIAGSAQYGSTNLIDGNATATGGINFQLGAIYDSNNYTTSIQNYTSSESSIVDVDMASEVSNLTKNQILQQSAMTMLAQANAEPQNVLKLLQSV